MAQIQATRQLGSITNQVLGQTIPIYGLEEISIGRAQNWDVSPASIANLLTVVWNGPAVIEYKLDFELHVGWGQITTRDKLFQMCKYFHAMCSQRKGVGAGNMLYQAPPPCLLVIGGGNSKYIDEIGFFRDVNTAALAPWGGTAGGTTGAINAAAAAAAAVGGPTGGTAGLASAGTDLSGAFPTSVRFTGTFWFAPGWSIAAGNPNIGLAVIQNTDALSMETVAEKFYTVRT